MRVGLQNHKILPKYNTYTLSRHKFEIIITRETLIITLVTPNSWREVEVEEETLIMT